MLDSAQAGNCHPKNQSAYDLTELKGWELRAAWDDLKLGIKHGQEFKKIALYGDQQWQEYVAKIGSWCISGEARYVDDKTRAPGWLMGINNI